MKVISKRLSWLLIVCVMLVRMLPMAVLAETDHFTIIMPENVEAASDEVIQLPVVVEHTGDVTHYNSFDLVFAYDPSMLRLTSTSISGMSVTPGNGTVRIVRYGDDLKVGSAAFILTFEILRSGKSILEVIDARVGTTETAHEQDAAAAVAENKVTVEILSAKSSDSHNTGNPRTGDAFDLAAWNSIAMTSLLALAVLILHKKKHCCK